MQYFDHDTTAVNDDAIMSLRLECGGAAVDAYWCILEAIYKDESACKAGANRALCHRLATTQEQLDEWVFHMCELGLLQRDVENEEYVHSERARENIERYHKKCETARQNAKSKASKSESKAGAKRTQSGRKASADNKRKEKKGIESHKGSQIPIASHGADADNSAPHEAIQCPVCEAEMERTVCHLGDKVLYRCDLCGEEVMR